MRYAIVDMQSGLVSNVVEYNADTLWVPPFGCTAVRSDVLEIGDVEPSAAPFVPYAPPPAPEPAAPSMWQRIKSAFVP